MARPNFVFITIEHDAEHDRYHAKLPYSDLSGASGAMGKTKEDAVRNLYNVMECNVVLVEDHADKTVLWVPTLGPPITIEIHSD